jgi:hypothetical protein
VGYQELKYFSEHHLLVENSHAAFEAAAKERVRPVEPSDDERQMELAVADNCFDAIEAMFDSILGAMATGRCWFRAA